MTLFWLSVAGLILLALTFPLFPLLSRPRRLSGGHAEMNVELYREQFAELERDLRNGTLKAEQYEESKAELERRMLADAQEKRPAVPVATSQNRMLAALLLVVIPLAAVPLYLKLGSPQAVLPQTAAVEATAGHGAGDPKFNQMIEKLAARLRDQTPEDGAGWKLLASSYAQQNRFAEAVTAFEKAAKLVPNDAQLLADYADVLAMANGQRFNSNTDELLKQALAINPSNPKALVLSGSSAFVRKDYAQALVYWEPLLKIIPPGTDDARELAAGIAEAKNFLKPGAGAVGKLDNLSEFAASKAPAPAAADAASTNVSSPGISGTVSLSPALAGKVSPGDKVFVFARAVTGPKMPLAIIQAQVKDLPYAFTLTDAMAMMPQLKLSNFPDVVVVARISKSGNASPQPGDLQGASGKLKAGEKNVQVTIDTVVP
jgi:cytochrome c-type biogenesis protein CcmH